jgi:NADPH2:quinone reductase
MRAVICREFGPPEGLELADLPDPTPGAGEVLITVEASGVNFPDALMVAGTYQVRPDRPFIPGSEVAGRVAAIGPGVQALHVGQRVTAFCGLGGYAELVVVAAECATPISDDVALEHAAVLPVAYGTAQHALVHRGRMSPAETLLVLGAAGGVGLAAVQLASAQGAQVTAVVSTESKADLVRKHGAHEVVVLPPEVGSSEVARDPLVGLAADAEFDLVLDAVGGAQAEGAIRRLAWGGRFLVVGFASGDIPRFRANRVLLNEGSVVGVLWGQWARRNPEANARMMRDLADLLSRKQIAPHLHRVFPLDQAAQALDEVGGRHVHGKVVLRAGHDGDPERGV